MYVAAWCHNHFGWPRCLSKGERDLSMAWDRSARFPARQTIVFPSFMSLLLVFLTSLSRAQDLEPHQSSGPAVISAKSLKTIIVDNYYPYTFENEEGMPDGFSVDIVSAVATVMGLELEVRTDTWERARKALDNGEIDLLPMMASSPERRESFDFSVPHTIAFDAIFVRKDSASVRSVEDLSNKTVIVMNRDVAHDYVLSRNIDGIRFLLVDSLPDALRALSSGKAEAALMPKLVGLTIVERLNLANIDPSPRVIEAYNRPFSFAVKKGNQVLLERLSQGLSIIKTTGRYDGIYTRWFGELEPKGVPWRTALKYIGGVGAGLTLVALALFGWAVSLRRQVALRTTNLVAQVQERKRAEEELRSLQLQVEFVLGATKTGLDIIDSDFNIRYIDPEWRKTYGDPSGRKCYEYFMDRDDVCSACGIVKALETKERIVTEEVLPKENNRPIQVTTMPFQSESGEWLVAEVNTDLTERKRAEDERVRLMAAMEQTAEAIVVSGLNGIITYANPAFERITGYSPAEAVDQSIDILRVSETDEGFYDRIRSDVVKGKVWRGALRRKRKDGSEFDAEVSISPVRNAAGGVTNVIAVTRDVTRETELERRLRQAQKMEAIGTLAGGIAHDFNNILYSILGYTEMALEELDKDNAAHEMLLEVAKGGQRAAELVNQILAITRKREKEYGPVLVQVPAKEALRMLEGTLPSTIEISENIDEGCGAVMADATELHQIALNLCTNAYHAMRERGGTLSVKLEELQLDKSETDSHPDLQPIQYVRLVVADTGYGIQPETMGRIFEPYFTTKETGEGTGLGLATVHGIVRGYGGAITVESVPGQGSTFTVFLPLATRRDAPPQEEAADVFAPGNGESLLVVDDEESLARLHRMALEQRGYRVTAFTVAGEALEAFRSSPHAFDLVVTDQTMPKMTGVELSKRLLEIRADIPVILCTGHSDLVDKDGAMAAGIRAYLKKPIVARALASTVRRLLDEIQGDAC